MVWGGHMLPRSCETTPIITADVCKAAAAVGLAFNVGNSNFSTMGSMRSSIASNSI